MKPVVVTSLFLAGALAAPQHYTSAGALRDARESRNVTQAGEIPADVASHSEELVDELDTPGKRDIPEPSDISEEIVSRIQELVGQLDTLEKRDGAEQSDMSEQTMSKIRELVDQLNTLEKRDDSTMPEMSEDTIAQIKQLVSQLETPQKRDNTEQLVASVGGKGIVARLYQALGLRTSSDMAEQTESEETSESVSIDARQDAPVAEAPAPEDETVAASFDAILDILTHVAGDVKANFPELEAQATNVENAITAFKQTSPSHNSSADVKFKRSAIHMPAKMASHVSQHQARDEAPEQPAPGDAGTASESIDVFVNFAMQMAEAVKEEFPELSGAAEKLESALSGLTEASSAVALQ